MRSPLFLSIWCSGNWRAARPVTLLDLARLALLLAGVGSLRAACHRCLRSIAPEQIQKRDSFHEVPSECTRVCAHAGGCSLRRGPERLVGAGFKPPPSPPANRLRGDNTP